jgi:RNA polymerase sigma factor (sigma-70 family)
MDLCNAGSAGVSVLEPDHTGDIFRWQALSGEIEDHQGGSTPRDWSPCGETLKAGRAMLYSYPARYFTYFQKLHVPIVEGLVIPMFSDGLPVGTIWVISHNSNRRFHAEHVRIMTSLGSFAVSALNGGNGRGESPQFAGASSVEKEIVWAEYVRRVARRDELALDSLFHETHALVFSTALRIVSFPVDAEEIAADVYARVWTIAGTFDARRGRVGAWLVTIARNRAIDRVRARMTRSRSETALLFQCSSGEDPDAEIDASQTRLRLGRALQALPFEQRQVIELAYFSELSTTEVAVKLGRPLGTVKTRLRQGLIKLRRLFAALETSSPKRRDIASFTRMEPDQSFAVAKRSA